MKTEELINRLRMPTKANPAQENEAKRYFLEEVLVRSGVKLDTDTVVGIFNSSYAEGWRHSIVECLDDWGARSGLTLEWEKPVGEPDCLVAGCVKPKLGKRSVCADHLKKLLGQPEAAPQA